MTERLAGFDGLRALAALLIVVLHVTSATGEVNSYTARLDIGVAVFFVISGFLLYRPFAAAHLGQRGVVSLRRFWLRRVVRIYPAYWVALTAAIVAFGSTELEGAWDHARHYLLVQIYEPAYGLAGIIPAWTLAVEVSFYAALPLYAAAIGALTSRAPVARRVPVELAAAGMLYAGALAWRWILVSERGTDAVSARWLPAMADWFALGILLAVAHVSLPDESPLRARLTRAAPAMPVLALLSYVAVCNIGLPTDGTSGTVADDMLRQVLFGAFGCFLVATAAFGGESTTARRALAHPVAVAVGTVSYGVFLWHFDWIEQLGAWDVTSTAPMLFAALGLAGLTATLSWLALERPLLRGAPVRGRFASNKVGQ